MKVHKGKYGQIHLIASLTAGLSRYHDEFAVSVVDEVGALLWMFLCLVLDIVVSCMMQIYALHFLKLHYFLLDPQVLEEIRLGLELNDYGMQQRRVAHVRFLGELYNYEHVDSSVIFETLYLILVFGHETAEVWN